MHVAGSMLQVPSPKFARFLHAHMTPAHLLHVHLTTLANIHEFSNIAYCAGLWYSQGS